MQTTALLALLKPQPLALLSLPQVDDAGTAYAQLAIRY